MSEPEAEALASTILELGFNPLNAESWPTVKKLILDKTDAGTVGYADTWTYLTQATNGWAMKTNRCGYFIRQGKDLCIGGLFRRPRDKRLAVHLVNPMGDGRVALVRTFCQRVAGRFPVYVKRADNELYEELSESGDFHWQPEFAWHADAPEEDDTFPEVELEVNTSLALFAAGRTNPVLAQLARFRNRVKGMELAWLPVSSLREEDARQVVAQFFRHKEERHIDISQPTDYENMICYPRPRASQRTLIREVCYIGGTVAAFLVMERIGDTEVLGLYCSIALYQKFPCLSEFVIQRALELANAHGYRYLNLGGSESEGLHRFKMKFKPVHTEKRNWLVFKE